MKPSMQAVIDLHASLQRCRRCPEMIPPVVVGEPILSRVMSVGQAPGDREGAAGRPFAWTAGKTLFKWFERIGVEEENFRKHVYMSAVCRCFPGKNPRGGDRVPRKKEILNCSRWLQQEYDLMTPELLIPIGKLAISEWMPVGKLTDVIGSCFEVDIRGREVSIIPLPHPSGASTWHRTEPGISLLDQALALIAEHPAWKQIFE
jgi:uracil-DNA glycosylase